jgi:hypothetical protein
VLVAGRVVSGKKGIGVLLVLFFVVCGVRSACLCRLNLCVESVLKCSVVQLWVLVLFSGSLKVMWVFFHEIFCWVRSSWSWVRIVGILFARKLAVMRASLPPSWCFTERFSAMTEIFLVWLKNWMYGCCSSIFSLFAASLGVHFCPKTRVW